MDKQYAVIEETEYYKGDCQHLKGWELKIATMIVIGTGKNQELECIDSLEECERWLKDLRQGPTYLGHGQAGKTHWIAEVIAEDMNYQDWIDGISDWVGCPAEDNEDWIGYPSESSDKYDETCEWAEDQAYRHGKPIPIILDDRTLIIQKIKEVSKDD